MLPVLTMTTNLDGAVRVYSCMYTYCERLESLSYYVYDVIFYLHFKFYV